jgi:hypothetical protein
MHLGRPLEVRSAVHLDIFLQAGFAGDSEDEVAAVVIDNGSTMIKVCI